MGRSALDEDAIRLLEERHPDVEFDWTRILKAPPESVPELPVRPRVARKSEDVSRRGARVNTPPAQARAETPAASLPAVDAPIELDMPDIVTAAPPDLETPTAALAKLGPEGLLRLRARYAELMTRIGQRVADSAQQEELKARAERLNPDTWVTDAEVSQGLDAYEATFESIRAVIGRPRKRRRRRRGPRSDAGPVNGGPGVEDQNTDADSAEASDGDADDEEPAD